MEAPQNNRKILDSLKFHGLSYLHSLVDIFYPVKCRFCSQKLNSSYIHDGFVCEQCWRKMVILRPPYCRICGHPFGDGEGIDCFACKALQNIHFDLARGIALYDKRMRKVIHSLKYEYHTEYISPLSRMVLDYFDTSNDYPALDAIVPVPLHPRRLRDREFNQSEVLFQPLSVRLNVPLINNVLYRTRYNIPQVGLNSEERMKNVEGLFAAQNKTLIAGKTILIVDDVMTTGATINACSKVLKDAGATAVYALCMTRGG